MRSTCNQVSLSECNMMQVKDEANYSRFAPLVPETSLTQSLDIGKGSLRDEIRAWKSGWVLQGPAIVTWRSYEIRAFS